MSSSLFWRPAESGGKDLGHVLKFALRARFNGPSSESEPIELTADSKPWLEGIRDSSGQGHEEAVKLIELIDQYGAVLVWESM